MAGVWLVGVKTVDFGAPLTTEGSHWKQGKDKIWALRILSLLGGMDNRGSRVGTGRII